MGEKIKIKEIEGNIGLLSRILQTLTKNPNRKFNHNALIRKIRYARGVKINSETILGELAKKSKAKGLKCI